MTAIAFTETSLRNAKRALVAAMPDAKSAHLSEALAAACGFGTHAALLQALAEHDQSDPDFILLDDAAFDARLCALDPSMRVEEDDGLGWFDWIAYPSNDEVIQTRSPRFDGEPYKGKRLLAWRNAMVAAINAGIEQRLFNVRPGDNRWPGAKDGSHFVYEFTVNGIPGIASVDDASWDELSIHVALWPSSTAREWVFAGNAGFLAGEVFAQGWLERRKGAWLQSSGKPGFWCRKSKLALVAGLAIRPRGFAERGDLIV